jgi:glycosyltransferase involved in cell wall biosynthesis
MRKPARSMSRVLMLIENLPFPQDVRVRQEARTLAGAGYQVSVISPAAPGQPRRESLDGVKVYRYAPPPSGKGFLAYAIEYSYAMLATFILALIVWAREGFDIIHAANPPDTFVFIASFFKLFGKRFVYDHHDLAPEMYSVRFGGHPGNASYRMLLALEKLSCRLADHVIVTNESYRRLALERGKVPAERITIVRNGPDLNRLRPAEPDPTLRPAGKTLLLYVGVIGVQDGVDHLLRAVAHLLRDLKREDFVCVIVGDGDALPGLRTLAAQLALGEHVRFAGWVEPAAVGRYLNAADICLAPEPSNNYNDRSTMIKIMEYMTMRKPTVAFDLPEHRFSAGEAAVYARANDDLDYARQIALLMDDPARREEMGRIGRQRVEGQLAWGCQAPALLSAYQKLRRAG